MNNSVSKFWNGTRWVYPYYLYPKIWNGTQWVQGIPKSWSGTAWNGAQTTWPIDPALIVSNIPSFSFGINNGTGSDHSSSWFLNTSPTDPFYILGGYHNTSNGSSDVTLSGGSVAGGASGDASSSSPLGTVIRFQQFLSRYCLTGSLTGVTWAQAWIEHQPQSSGWLTMVWNNVSNWTLATTGGTEGTYAGGSNGLQWRNGTGDSRLALAMAAPGTGFVAAAIQLMLKYAKVYDPRSQLLLNKLQTYSWTTSNITSNFTDFASWVSANGSSGGGSALDTWTLTVGSYPLINGVTINGYNSGLAGTLSPATSSVFGGASVGFIEDINGVSMFFGVNSTATQAQFTTLTVNGTVYSSSAATFTWTGSLAEWNWTEPNGNPFPAVGQTCIVTLT